MFLLKNKKGQTSVIVTVFGLIVILLLLISVSIAGGQAKRNLNYVENKQLDKLTEGGVYQTMAILKKEIDFNKYNTVDKHQRLYFPDINKHGYNEIDLNGKKAKMESDVSIYKGADPLFNASVEKQFFEVGEFEKVIPINNAHDVCFEIIWDKDNNGNYATVSFEVLKETVKNDGSIVYNPVKLPVSESDGRIGTNPAYCDASNPARLAENEIYDPTLEKRLIHGYGNYKVKVSASGATPVNLQTKGLYNRLSYRTFEIITAAKYGDTIKKNTKVIVKASYDVNNESNVVPKFEYLHWYEGDE